MAIGILVIAFYAIWLLISALYQVDFSLAVWIKKLDALALLPRWKFFAPNPSVADYKLFVRDRLADRSVTTWREIELSGEKTLAAAVWNPARRRVKVVVDAMRRIRILAATPEADPEVLAASLPYLTLLQVATDSAHLDSSHESQFAVMQVSGLKAESPPRLVFHSRFHNLVGVDTRALNLGKPAGESA